MKKVNKDFINRRLTMATAKELLDNYYKIYGKQLSRTTLTNWVKKHKIIATELPKEQQKGNCKYDYDLDSFLSVITSTEYKNQIMGRQKNPKDFIGKISGNLLITGIVPQEEKQTHYNGTLMYCTCLRCGKKNIQVRFSYLSGNENYHRDSCGCIRKREAFKATNMIKDLEDDFLDSFDDFDKFLFIHRTLRTGIGDISYLNKEQYKELINHFYCQQQFNNIYNFWQQQNKTNTFYDWAKPSIDHIIPKAKGGTNEINNLQYLTIFENLSKRDMTMEEWNNFKKQTHTTSDYFYESIKEVMQ